MQLFEKTSGRPAFLEVAVPQNRMRVIQDMVKISIEQLRDGKLTIKLIQQTVGTIIAAIYHKRHRIPMDEMKVLYMAADERRFNGLIRRKPFREALKQALHTMGNIIWTTPPIKFMADLGMKRLAIAYSDASLEKTENGMQCAALGGVIFLCGANGIPSTNVRFAYSLRISEPVFSIAVYEMIALILVMGKLPNKMHNIFRVAYGVDNSNVLYAVSKAFSGSTTLAAALSILLENIREGATLFFTPSKDNFADILTRCDRMKEISEARFIEKTDEDMREFEKVNEEVKKRAAKLENDFIMKTTKNTNKRRKLNK